MLGESNLEMTSPKGAFDALAVDQIPLLDSSRGLQPS